MSPPSPKPRVSKSPREILRALLMLDDTAHSIALGTAIGIAIGMTPTVGAQMIMVMIVAFLTRPLFHFNRMAALIAVYISNPVTMIPIYWFLYKVGTLFVGGEMSRETFASIFEYNGFSEWWATICDIFIGIGWPLLIGTVIVATISGLATYPLMLWLIKSFRREPQPPAEAARKPKESVVN